MKIGSALADGVGQGEVALWVAVHGGPLAVVVAGYRKGLVSARWTVCLLSCKNGRKNLCKDSISGILGRF